MPHANVGKGHACGATIRIIAALMIVTQTNVGGAAGARRDAPRERTIRIRGTQLSAEPDLIRVHGAAPGKAEAVQLIVLQDDRTMPVSDAADEDRPPDLHSVVLRARVIGDPVRSGAEGALPVVELVKAIVIAKDLAVDMCVSISPE